METGESQTGGKQASFPMIKAGKRSSQAVMCLAHSRRRRVIYDEYINVLRQIRWQSHCKTCLVMVGGQWVNASRGLNVRNALL